MENNLTKYAELFNNVSSKKGFKEAVDYMGIYFFGLIDNLGFEEFYERFFESMATFVEWLVNGVPEEVWEDAFKDTKPLLFKLIDSIEETAQQPDSLPIMLKKSIASLSPFGKANLHNIADYYIDKNKPLYIVVDAYWDEDKEEYMYQYEFKVTKNNLKVDKKQVETKIIEALSLVAGVGGVVQVIVKEKGKETISAFCGGDNQLESFNADELEDMFDDYILESDKIINFETFDILKNKVELG